ncbi:MAG: hypothetical protein R6U70_02460 [Bacillota bacterium]
MREDRDRRAPERAGTGMVGPLHRQVDDAAVKPTPDARRVSIQFPGPSGVARARSALSRVGHVIDGTAPNTLELTVDGEGMQQVREIATRLRGHLRIGK